MKAFSIKKRKEEKTDTFLVLCFFMARKIQNEAGEILCSSYERWHLPEKLFPARRAVEGSFDNSDQEVL